MPVKGLRRCELSNQQLIQRLSPHVPNPAALKSVSKARLLGAAIFHNVVNPNEAFWTSPTVETTVPCYLASRVRQPERRRVIDDYVVAYSKAMVRGSWIANLAVSTLCTTNLRPRERFQLCDWGDDIRRAVDFIDDVERLKHCFVPELWPTSKVCRDPLVDAVLSSEGVEWLLSHYVPDYDTVCSQSTMWHQVANRLGTQYQGNIQVHVRAGLIKAIEQHLGGAEGSRGRLFRGVTSVVADDVSIDAFEEVVTLRRVVGCEDLDTKPPSEIARIPYSRECLALHLFLVSHRRCTGRTTLPLATRGRKYAYLDEKIARQLFKVNSCDLPLTGTKKRQRGEDIVDDTSRTTWFQDFMGLTPRAFNKTIRSKKHRKSGHHRGKGLGPRARVSSILTDGVGLRVVVKTPIDMTPFVGPLTTAPANKKSTDALQAVRSSSKGDPVFVGIDTGRAKPYVAAISTSPTKKPVTEAFTRRRYYHEMGQFTYRRWDRRRVDGNPELRDALSDLSATGGVVNWTSFLHVDQMHDDVLNAEYLLCKERAMWRMETFRKKRSSLDRAMDRILRHAGRRPVVVGVGSASFPSTGKGEKAVPTTELLKALKRAIQRRNASRVNGASVEVPIWEHRTTLCCCACGQETSRPVVMDGKTGKLRESRRLRLCTSPNCCDTAKETTCKLRDRDVQGARNILWLIIHQYLGLERPLYLCTLRVRREAGVVS